MPGFFLYVFWQSTYVGIFCSYEFKQKDKIQISSTLSVAGTRPWGLRAISCNLAMTFLWAPEPLFGYRFCYQIFTIVKDNDIHLFLNIHIYLRVCCFEVVASGELDVYTC